MDSTSAPHFIEHRRKTLDYTPHDTKWIPHSSRFVCTGISSKGKGVVEVYQLSSDGLSASSKRTMQEGIKCCTFGASSLEDRLLAYGDYSGTLSMCDIERSDTSDPVYSVQGHKSIINAIDGIGGINEGHGAPELVTGSRDGCVRLWDPRINKPVLSMEPEDGQNPRDCWAVSFGNSYSEEERCICAGYDNGDVKMFDLRKNSIIWETNCNNGVTSIEFDRDDIEMNKMVVTTLESKFRCYDLRTQHKTDDFAFLSERSHRSTVWLAKHLPQNRDIFMTGGGNGGFNVYKYHYPRKRVDKHKEDQAPIGVVGSVELLNSRVVSTQPIVSFDWSPDREGLASMCCLDQTLRVYIVTNLDKY
mmetsp:Transcript_56973/g.68529  ORF Transcript_56973/g.68529 Transcript_56973/m.68529 type:complete len:360 (+) Transcript_56973:24-1103(+)